jgi:DNA gyrase inhibitor GyrI
MYERRAAGPTGEGGAMPRARGVVGTFILLAALAAGAGAQSTAPAAAPADYEVRSVEAIHALVLPMKGSYMQHQQAFEKLGGYLAGHGVSPSAAPFARYFSDPSTPETELQWEVGFAVSPDVTAEAPFEIRDVPAEQAVVHVYRGSYEGLGTAWSDLMQWVLANGYQPTGPAFQSFGGDWQAPVIEMRLPVHKP